MQKPLTVTECKWMLIWGPILPHFHCVWELSHHILYTIGIVSLLQLDFLHPSQKLKVKWICLNYYVRTAIEMDVNEFYSIWLKYPIITYCHCRKYQCMHLNSTYMCMCRHTHIHKAHTEQISWMCCYFLLIDVAQDQLPWSFTQFAAFSISSTNSWYITWKAFDLHVMNQKHEQS